MRPIEFTPIVGDRECPVCGTRAVRHHSPYPSWTEPFASCLVYYCSDCGSGHVPDCGEMLMAFYAGDYATTNRRDRHMWPIIYFSKFYRNRKKQLQTYFRRAQRQVALMTKLGAFFGDILDFGSGPGYLLHVSGAKGKFAYEPDPASVKYLRYLGARRLVTVSDISRHRFDVIVASHSIEHLEPEHLVSTLSVLIGALKTDGLLLTEVPHGGLSFLTIGGRHDPHTLFFTAEGLQKAIERAGGEIVHRSTVSRSTIPGRHDAIYSPPEDPFLGSRRGGLTIVCRKRAA